MKKITVCILVSLMIFTLSACGNKDGNEADITAGVSKLTTEAATTQAETQAPSTEVRKSLSAADAAYIYNKAYSLASVWFNFYNEYQNYDDSLMNDDGMYYAINHETVNSVAALKEHLSGYLSERLINSLVAQAYIEKDGKLYHLCYETGDLMPTYMLNQTTATLTSEAEDKATFDIAVMQHFDKDFFGDEYQDTPETVSVDYIFENESWVIDNYFTVTLYVPFEWDGESPAAEK